MIGEITFVCFKVINIYPFFCSNKPPNKNEFLLEARWPVLATLPFCCAAASRNNNIGPVSPSKGAA